LCLSQISLEITVYPIGLVNRKAATEGEAWWKVAVLLTYVTVCGAVKEKTVFVLY